MKEGEPSQSLMGRRPDNLSGAPVAAAGLRYDLIAGLTASAVVLPKAMAYATVAGLPVTVGLYTALVPMLIYALLGSSRALSVSSTTTIAILAGTQLGLVVPDGDPAKLITATATLTALVGAILIVARLLRLGFAEGGASGVNPRPNYKRGERIYAVGADSSIEAT